MPPSFSLPLKQITAILKNCHSTSIFYTLICANSFQIWNNIRTSKFWSFIIVSYQSLHPFNFVVISFFNWQTILFSWASTAKFQRGYCVITICLQQHCLLDHRMSLSIRFVIARRKSQSNYYFKFLPAISLFCPLFHFFAPYFTFLPAISIRTARRLTNQIWETMHSM